MTDKRHYCYECDAEFYVEPAHKEDVHESISFCPYCGSEMDYEEQEDDIEEEFFEEDDE